MNGGGGSSFRCADVRVNARMAPRKPGAGGMPRSDPFQVSGALVYSVAPAVTPRIVAGVTLLASAAEWTRIELIDSAARALTLRARRMVRSVCMIRATFISTRHAR